LSQKKERNDDINGAGIIVRSLLRAFAYVASILLTIAIIGLITGIVVGSTFALYIDQYIDVNLDDFEYLSTNQDLTTRIFYQEDGKDVEIEEARLYKEQNRLWVSYSDIPKNLINAFVAIEDHRFWEHEGVDFITTAKATLKYFTGKTMGGGSSITQQLVKNVTGDDDVTVQRKIQEIKRAMAVEDIYDKTEILELYLNIIYLSEGCYGVQSAAQTYFGKDVGELTLVECAAIASITQNPYKWDPFIFPENNKERRDTVLWRMYEVGYLTEEEAMEAINTELVLYYGDETGEEETEESGTNSWYTDATIEEAINLIMEHFGYSYETASNALFTGGFQIFTAMDPKIQSIMEEVFEDESYWPKADSSAIQPESAMVIMNPQNGYVLGLVGGRGEKTINRGYNLATQAKRPPGSSIKPLSLYAPAIDKGLVTWASPIDDTPFNFGTEKKDPDGNITYSRLDGYPNNYPAGYRGLTPVWDAVRRSVNTCAMKVLQKVTLNESYEFLTSTLGLNTIVDYEETPAGIVSDLNWAPLGLGQLSYGVTVKAMTAAYCIFANDGIYTEPRIVLKICDSEGKVIIDNTMESTIAISEETAAIMTKMMQNVVSTGTASNISLKNKVECAGKTGTTSDDYDRYYVGYTPYYVGGIWFGYKINQSLSKFSTSPATIIWDTIMTRVHEDIFNECAENGEEVKKFNVPSTVVKATYCKDSGKIATDACSKDPRGSRIETGYFSIDTVPSEKCDCHVLVAYDSITGGIACKECPENHITWVGLIEVNDREYPSNITVTDAQYVYRDIGSSYASTDPYTAFFTTILPEGKYAGKSGSGMPYNRMCSHYDPLTSDGLYGVERYEEE